MIDQASYSLFLSLECNPEFKIFRSACERYDDITGLRVDVEKQTIDSLAIIRRLAARENTSELGRSSRETIRIEWDAQLYTASSQDNADADYIEWGGTRWRVIEVQPPRDCTWIAIAVRDDQPCERECEHDAEPSVKQSSYHLVGGGRV